MDKQYFKLLINFINAGNYLCKMAINIFIFDFKSSLLHYWQLLTPWNYYKTLLTIFCSNNFLNNDGIQEFSTSVNKKFTVPSFSPILNIVKFITSLTHRSSRMLIADSTFICPFTTLHDNSNRAFFITLDSLPRKFFSFITLHCLILKKMYVSI